MNKLREFEKTFQAICKKNTLVIIMLLFLCPVLGFSYASFVIRTDHYRASEMYIGSLLYSVKIDEGLTNIINIEANSELEIVVEVTSLNEVATKYKLIYESDPDIKIIYASDENEITSGVISTTKKSSLLIVNSSGIDKTVKLYVMGGYYNNDISDIDVGENYTEITNPYKKYDFTINYYVNGVLTPNLDIGLIYKMSSYSCTNNETLTYYPYTNKIEIAPYLNHSTCNVNLKYNEYSPVYSYSCANGLYGMEPYKFTYSGDCEVIDDDNNNWKIKFLTSGKFSTTVENSIDILAVGSGYNSNFDFDSDVSNNSVQQYNSIVLNRDNEYDINISSGGTDSVSYFGSADSYSASSSDEGSGMIIIRKAK